MADGTIGIAVTAPDPASAVARIVHAEEMGVAAVWLTSGGGGGDALTLLAAAAARTQSVLLGTSIVQSWSRHPVTVAEQVRVVAGLAPSRFRLGVGPSHRGSMETTFGADFRAPLGHLKEYLGILKALVQEGKVEFEGEYYTAHASMPVTPDVPVMASALRPGAFELCGAEADGAISWVCPHQYLRDVGLPALRTGAERAGREAPPLVVHAPVCVHEDVEAVRAGVRAQLGYFPLSPFYASMFAEAGFAGSADTGWTDQMLESVVILGDEGAVTERLEGIFAWGASEVLATVVTPQGGGDEASDRTMRLLARLSTPAGTP